MLGIAADDDTNHATTMTSDNQPVDTVEISGGEDPLAFLDDNVPATLDACQTLEDLTQHLSRYQPKDAEAVTAAKQRICPTRRRLRNGLRTKAGRCIDLPQRV